MNRRQFFTLVGAGGITSFAGCSDSGGSQDSTPERTESDSASSETSPDQETSTTTDQDTSTATPQGPEASPLSWYTEDRDEGHSRSEPEQSFESTEYGINWQSETGSAADRILSDGDRIYFQSDTVWAMDSNGNELWSKVNDDVTYSDLHYYDEKLVMMAGESVFIADAETGERIAVLAETPMTQNPRGFSLMTETGLYVTTEGGQEPTFGVVDAAAEEVVLDKTFIDEDPKVPVRFDPTDILGEGDTIYALGLGEDDESYEQYMYLMAFNGRSGEILSLTRMEPRGVHKIVKSGDTFVSLIQTETGTLSDNTYGMFAFTADDPKWENPDVLDAQSAEDTEILVDNSNAYVVEGQSAFALDLSSGEEIWRYNSTQTLPEGAISTGDALLIPNEDEIIRVDNQSGEGERLKVNSNGVPMEWGAAKIRPAANGIYGFGNRSYHIAKVSELETPE